MSADKAIPAEMSSLISQSAEQTRKVMESYMELCKKSAAALPFQNTELNEKLRKYVEKSSGQALDYANKLAQAKDISDIVRIQTEFVQAQLHSLNEQASEISEMTKKMAEAFKTSLGSS
jgi:hypothetical protein